MSISLVGKSILCGMAYKIVCGLYTLYYKDGEI